MQTLEHLRESLAHYPAHAQIEPPVEVNALRGGNELSLEVGQSEEYTELKDDYECICKECDKYEMENDEMKTALRQIREVVQHENKNDFQTIMDVLKILDEGGY